MLVFGETEKQKIVIKISFCVNNNLEIGLYHVFFTQCQIYMFQFIVRQTKKKKKKKRDKCLLELIYEQNDNKI